MRLTFEGKTKHNTRPGAFMSMLVIACMSFILVMKLIHFVEQKDAFQMINKKPFNYEPLNLRENEFLFAVENIDETVGRLEAFFVSWPIGGEKKKRPIELIRCSEFMTKYAQSLKE